MDYGTQVRVMRAVRGKTQIELADIIGISNKQLGWIENNRMLPTPDLAAAIREALAWPDNADEAFALLETAN